MIRRAKIVGRIDPPCLLHGTCIDGIAS